MLHVLTRDILPVFALLALGFAMGRGGAANGDEARALNRIAFLVLQPPLIFLLMIGLDTASFDLAALAIYAGCESLALALAYLAARHLFGRDPLESWLLAMAVIFVNTLLYIWPIAQLIYGPEGARPISAIVAWDAAVMFGVFIVSLELLTGRARPARTARRIVANPVLLAVLAGLAVNLTGAAVPEPLLTAARFAGAAAAPLTLFALGVVLSGHPLRPTPMVASLAACKLVLFPAMVLAGLALAVPEDPNTAQFVLTAAGPSGAMAFSLAMLYGVRTDAIAPVIIWTSALSLFSLAYLA